MTRAGRLARNVALAVAITIATAVGLELAARQIEQARTRLPARPPGTFRLVAVGGSVVHGTPVPELGVVTQLELALRRLEPDARLEVFNLGTPGQSSFGERRSVAQSLDAGADLLLLLSGHNEFLDQPRMTGFRGRLRRWLQGLALARIETRLFSLLKSRFFLRDEDILPDRLAPFPRPSEEYDARVEAFRTNVDAMVSLAREHGTPLLLLTAPANLADWPPVHQGIAWSLPDPGYDAGVAHLQELLAQHRCKEVLPIVHEKTSRFGEDAMWLWLAGKARQCLGENEAAYALFQRAKDLDPYPWRALGEFNDWVRTYEGTDGVTVIDAERLFRERSEHGLVGFDLLADNCHPTPLGNALLAQAIARTMAGQGLFLSRDPGSEPAERWAARTLQALGARSESLYLDYLLANASYAMKTPFGNYVVAQRWLDEALTRAPDDWRVWANLGVVALLAGDSRTGSARLEKAAELKGAPLDPDDWKVHPYLGVALKRARGEETAASQ